MRIIREEIKANYFRNGCLLIYARCLSVQFQALVYTGHDKEDAFDQRHLRDAAAVQGAQGVAVQAGLQDVHGQHPRQAQGAGKWL